MLFLQRCAICGAISDVDGLCSTCASSVVRIGAHCLTCAREVADERIPCGGCLASPPPFERVYVGFRYRDTVRDVLLQVKYGKSRAAIKVLQYWSKRLAASLPSDTFDMIVPMPMALPRLLQRGFNQTHYLAQTVSRTLQLPCAKALLHKAMRSPQSKQVSDAARQRNIKGAFYVKQQCIHKHILLVDDVLTSGATVKEAARILKAGGAQQISVLAIAAR